MVAIAQLDFPEAPSEVPYRRTEINVNYHGRETKYMGQQCLRERQKEQEQVFLFRS